MKVFKKWFWIDAYYDFYWGIRNLKSYFKIIWNIRPWDFRYALPFLKKHLEDLEKNIHSTFEESENSKKTRENIKRCEELIDRLFAEEYVELLGGLTDRTFEFEPLENGTYRLKDERTEEEHKKDAQTIIKATEMEDEDWKALWETISKDGRNWWV